MLDSVAPRSSASVILVRDGARGLETFMVRRHARSPVAPSAYVFPGGTVREDDADLHLADVDALAAALGSRSDTPVNPHDAAALYVAALRELFEEAGVLLVHDPAGAVLQVDATDAILQERLESTRLALQARELSLAQVLQDWHWTPSFESLVPFSHWVTPDVLAARFDTRFFVAEMPPAQAALHDTIELSEGVWLSPSRVLDGDYHTVYATAAHLRRLAPFPSVSALLAFAAQKPIRRVQPQVIEAGEGLRVSLAPDLTDAW
jgi:8-oxo-dGTP pyrophosphatase MutT (NUDIX family)